MIDPGGDFYSWIGKCITAWAQVEKRLFTICHRSLNTTKQRAAIIYYRTPTIDSRLKLVDELVRTALPIKQRKNGGHDHKDVIYWDKLRKDITAHFPLRNRIAHQPVTRREYPEISAVADIFGQNTFYYSDASEEEKARGQHDETKPLDGPALSMHRVEVESLITRLDIFVHDVLSKHV